MTRGLLRHQRDLTNTKAAQIENQLNTTYSLLTRGLDLTDMGDAAPSVSPTSEEKTKK